MGSTWAGSDLTDTFERLQLWTVAARIRLWSERFVAIYPSSVHGKVMLIDVTEF